jgi:hypothetical protein
MLLRFGLTCVILAAWPHPLWPVRRVHSDPPAVGEQLEPLSRWFQRAFDSGQPLRFDLHVTPVQGDPRPSWRAAGVRLGDGTTVQRVELDDVIWDEMWLIRKVRTSVAGGHQPMSAYRVS